MKLNMRFKTTHEVTLWDNDVGGFVRYVFDLTIDCDKLTRKHYQRARASKSGKATIAGGAIVIEHVNKDS